MGLLNPGAVRSGSTQNSTAPLTAFQRFGLLAQKLSLLSRIADECGGHVVCILSIDVWRNIAGCVHTIQVAVEKATGEMLFASPQCLIDKLEVRK